MLRWWILLLSFLGLCTLDKVLAATPVTAQVSTPTRFAERSQFHLVPQISLLSLANVTLRNKGSAFHYTEGVTGIPAFQLRASYPLWRANHWLRFIAEARTGFSSTSASIPVSANGAQSNETMRLSWLPVSSAVRTQFFIPGFDITPELTIGAGGQWLSQSSASRSDLNGDFFVPFYFISPSLHFLQSNSAEDWFGGFAFGVGFQDSFRSVHTVRSWSFDLSFTVYL